MGRKKTLEESGYRWARGCVRAHLDRSMPYTNVLGVLRGSDLEVIRQILRETEGYGDHDNWRRLADEFGMS